MKLIEGIYWPWRHLYLWKLSQRTSNKEISSRIRCESCQWKNGASDKTREIKINTRIAINKSEISINFQSESIISAKEFASKAAICCSLRCSKLSKSGWRQSLYRYSYIWEWSTQVKVYHARFKIDHLQSEISYVQFIGKTLIKKDLSLTAQKWQSVQENKKIKVQTLPDDPPSVKRSQSFQSTKSDEKDIRIKELEKQLAKAKGKSCEFPILLHIGNITYDPQRPT